MSEHHITDHHIWGDSEHLNHSGAIQAKVITFLGLMKALGQISQVHTAGKRKIRNEQLVRCELCCDLNAEAGSVSLTGTRSEGL